MVSGLPFTLGRKIQAKAKLARLSLTISPFPIHPYMLRHTSGYKLVNDGHDTRAIQHYPGHKNIQHTVLYNE